jgi:hypothetical protein
VPPRLLGNGERLAADRVRAARLARGRDPAQRGRVSRHRRLRLRLPARREAGDARLVRAACARGRRDPSSRRTRAPHRDGGAARGTGVTAALVDDAGRRTGKRLRVRAPRVVVAPCARDPVLLARAGSAAVTSAAPAHPSRGARARRCRPAASPREGVPQAWHVAEFEADGIFLAGQFTRDLARAEPSRLRPRAQSAMAAYDRNDSFGR